MNKIKIFVGAGDNSSPNKLENQINDWLKNNSLITIISHQMTYNRTWGQMYISIIYFDNEAELKV
jgi:hypothetical protein